MKRILTTILALNTLLIPAAAVLDGQENVAPVATSAQTLSVPTDELIYPSSYEQYLKLDAPLDVATSQGYTAIADGAKIYIYDKANETYLCYEHTKWSDSAFNRISEVQFTQTGDLYFLDGNYNVFYLTQNSFEMGNLTPTETDFNCSAFAIYSNTIYYTVVTGSTQIVKATLTDAAGTSTPIVEALENPPIIALQDNSLYYTQYGTELFKYNENQTNDRVYSFTNGISSACIYGNNFICTEQISGKFYVYDLPALLNSGKNETIEPIFSDDSNVYKSVRCTDGEVYAITGQSIKQFSIEKNKFTDFEIGSASKSKNRLYSAADTTVYKNLVLTVDNFSANEGRISIYDKTDSSYRTIATEIQANYIATDGETALVANTERAELYSLTSGELLKEFSSFTGYVVGIAGVYGKYYFVTRDAMYYCATQTDGVWSISGNKKTLASEPKLLSSNAHGELYVAYTDDVVRTFTESEFTDQSKNGTLLSGTIPTDATKISIDYNGDVYALKDGVIYKGSDDYSLEKTVVYGQTSSTPVTSIAFGIEDNETYVLYNQNFIVKTPALNLPTVKNITVGDADDEIFASSSAVFSILKTSKNALVVNFDVSKLNGADVFPYLSYERTETERTALKIGETSDYYILAELNSVTKKYSTFIVEKTACTQLDEDDYLITYTNEQVKDGYLTNAVNVYKYPYLNKQLTVTEATKNSKIKLLGEIVGLDYDYYHVEYVDAEGNTQLGYVPKAYVTDRDCTPPQSSHQTYNDFTPDTDSVWRMVYILLGTAAICILTSYFVIHFTNKKK